MEKKSIFLQGEQLYGDDFSYEAIKQWYQDEQEAYANLGSNQTSSYKYTYHELNKINGFQYLKKVKYPRVLSIGGAYGHELLPILDKIEHITILEPSQQIRQKELEGLPITYVEPNIDGTMPFEDNSFDLITCFGVLHHIPNVSFVLSEIQRVLTNEGVFLLREPIVSMGDWTKPRRCLTKHERGIPLKLFSNMLSNANFRVKKSSLCFVKPLDGIVKKLFKIHPFNRSWFVYIDKILCQLTKPNYTYHATKKWKKIRPVSIFYVLEGNT